MNIYYFVLKHYKGIFQKKHKGNTHLFMIPITGGKYVYLGLLGELVDEDGSYACQLIVRLDDTLLDTIIIGEEEYFGDRFVQLEELPCKVGSLGSGDYKIKLEKKGNYIGSDLKLTYNVEYSTDERRIYILRGKLNFEAEDVTSSAELKMSAIKQMAFIGGRNRFFTHNKKKNIGGSK